MIKKFLPTRCKKMFMQDGSQSTKAIFRFLSSPPPPNDLLVVLLMSDLATHHHRCLWVLKLTRELETVVRILPMSLHSMRARHSHICIRVHILLLGKESRITNLHGGLSTDKHAAWIRLSQHLPLRVGGQLLMMLSHCRGSVRRIVHHRRVHWIARVHLSHITSYHLIRHAIGCTRRNWRLGSHHPILMRPPTALLLIQLR